MSGPTWLPPKHLTTGEQATTSVSVSAPAVFRPQKKFATIPVPKSNRCEQNGSSALGHPPLYQTTSTGGFAIGPLAEGSESHASNSGDFQQLSSNTTEHYYPAAPFSSEGRVLSAWGPSSPSYQMQGVSQERGGYHPSSIDAEIDSLTSMLADMENSGPRRQVEPPAYDAMAHSSSAPSAAFNSKLSTGYKPKQAAYVAAPYTGSYSAGQKTSGYGAAPQGAPYKTSSMTASAYNPAMLESNATAQTGGYIVSQSSQNQKSYPQPMPASYTTASSSSGPALNVQVKVAQPVVNYTEPRQKAEQAYGPPSPRLLGPSYPPLYSTEPSEPSYRTKMVPEQSYRGPQPMEQLYKGHQTTEPIYRGPQTTDSSYRAPTTDPPYKGHQSSEPSYRGPQSEPAYRGPQTTEASYRMQMAEQSYRGHQTPESSYRGSQPSELSYRGHQVVETSHRGPPTNEQSYRAPQAMEPSYREQPHIIESTYRGPQTAEQSHRGSQTRGLQSTDISYRAPQSSEPAYRGLQNTDQSYRAPPHNSDVSNRAQQNRYPDLKAGQGQNWYQTSLYSSGNDSAYNDAEMSQDRRYGQSVKKTEADMCSAGNKATGLQQQVAVGRVNREQSAQPTGASAGYPQQGNSSRPEEELDRLTKKLVHDMNHPPVREYFGRCARCGENVVGDGTGCIAMDQVFHEDCFTCISCHCRLRGQPFYAIEKKSYCEACYIVTLEKCSMCGKPILDRILRAMGQAYHPQCFICVVCRRCLDGVPFTVDATSQIHCIDDFHRKFAPRCSVCGNAIMPEPGQEETVRIVALDRSFHINCYKCEECGLVLSSEGEGRGCYPLDGHILCKSCSARRIQELSSKITTDC